MSAKNIITTVIISGVVSSGVYFGFDHFRPNPVSVVKQDLLEHPEFLVEVANRLDQNRRDNALNEVIEASLNNMDVILHDPKDPVVGSKSANIAIVEFFDYQCPYCKQFAPVVASVLKNNPDVKVIYKESATFSVRDPASGYAANIGLAVYQNYGEQTFEQYQEGMFGLSFHEGDLTHSQVDGVLSKLNIDKSKLDLSAVDYRPSLALFRTLHFKGTPATLVIRTDKPASKDTVKFVDGAKAQDLLEAIHDLRG